MSGLKQVLLQLIVRLAIGGAALDVWPTAGLPSTRSRREQSLCCQWLPTSRTTLARQRPLVGTLQSYAIATQPRLRANAALENNLLKSLNPTSELIKHIKRVEQYVLFASLAQSSDKVVDDVWPGVRGAGLHCDSIP